MILLFLLDLWKILSIDVYISKDQWNKVVVWIMYVDDILLATSDLGLFMRLRSLFQITLKWKIWVRQVTW